jgi:hypothetical protein
MNRALEKFMGMGTRKWEEKIFFREWEWEPEKVVPAGHYIRVFLPNTFDMQMFQHGYTFK